MAYTIESFMAWTSSPLNSNFVPITALILFWASLSSLNHGVIGEGIFSNPVWFGVVFITGPNRFVTFSYLVLVCVCVCGCTLYRYVSVHIDWSMSCVCWCVCVCVCVCVDVDVSIYRWWCMYGKAGALILFYLVRCGCRWRYLDYWIIIHSFNQINPHTGLCTW